MKTPEEIKKGLDHCGEDGCKDCPYVRDCTMTDGFSELAKDSLAYIKQLEDGIEQWEYVAASPGAVEDIARENAQMQAGIDRQREKIRVLELSLQAVNDGNAALQRENLMHEGRLPRWISVEERLPEVSAESNGYQITDVVLATTAGYICFGHFEIFKYNGSWEFVSVDTDCDFDRSVTITHWMPLPEPPKEE